MQVVSWDGNDLNDASYATTMIGGRARLPEVAVQIAPRTGRWPVLSGVKRSGKPIRLSISVKASGVESALDDLCAWFDPEDETSKALIISDDDNSNQRYVMATCRALVPQDEKRHLQVATLVIDGDVRWRSTTTSTTNWSVTASGDTQAVTNDGKDDAYPVISITPTSYKSGGGASSYTYRRFIAVRWRISSSYTQYPIDICNDSLDTDALVTAGKMQADGDDLRVEVNAVEVDRWLDGIDTVSTKVWVNLNFQAKQESTISAAIGSGDTVTSLQVDDSIAGFPS